MKRISINQRNHSTMLGAVAARLGDLSGFNALGVSDRSLVAMALAADPVAQPTEHWRRAPFGSAKRGTKANQRKAAKRRAVVRARRLGHA